MVIDPVKVPGPSTSRPIRLVPVAKAPVTKPSWLGSLVGVVLSVILIEPVLITVPVKPPRTWRPMVLSRPVAPNVPALVTELLLSSVRSMPGLVMPMDPLEDTVTSAGPPLLAVEVFTGVLVAVEMVTWARVGMAAARRGAVAAAAARNVRFMKDSWLAAA